MEELSGFQVHTNTMLWIFCADFPKLRFEGKTDKQTKQTKTNNKLLPELLENTVLGWLVN